MKKSHLSLFLLHAFFASAACIYSLSDLRAEEVLFEDDFSGSSLSPNWTAANTEEAKAPELLDGRLSEIVTTANSSQRSLLISTRSDFNPFVEPLTVVLEEPSIQGAPLKNGYSGNLLYALIGNINNGQGRFHGYNPWQDADTAGYLALTFEKCITVNGIPFWRMQIIDRAAKATLTTLGLYGAKTPSSIEWTVDGSAKTWKIQLQGGAKFYTGADIPGVAYEEDDTIAKGSFEHFSEESVTAGSYLVLGAMNHYEVTEGTRAELGAVKVLSDKKSN